MNWGGFPIAFRFPVQDFSLETKKRCWSYVLPALRYADLTDSTLLEAKSAELFDPDQPIYIAIVAPKSITPSRKNSLLWRKDGRLMSALALYWPVGQENFLELFTDTKMLAEITPERNIVPKEDCDVLFPDRIERKEKASSRHKALILPKGELPFSERDALCRRTMRELYEKDESLSRDKDGKYIISRRRLRDFGFFIKNYNIRDVKRKSPFVYNKPLPKPEYIEEESGQLKLRLK